MKRVLLGSLETPSKNTVDVYQHRRRLPPRLRSPRGIACEWDRFPLSAEDQLFYVLTILPAITKRAQEYLEKPGRALVVRR